MRTEDLIVRLAAGVEPVRPVSRAGVRLGAWLALSAPIVIVMVALAGARQDIVARLGDPRFLLTITVLGAGAIGAAFATLSLSVPNAARPAAVRLLPIGAAALWVLLLVSGFDRGDSIAGQFVAEPVHAACLFQISAAALLPAILLVRLVRQGAPLQPIWTGTLAVAAALAAGAIGSQLICPIDRAAHHVIWHLLPVIALSPAGVIVAKRWLSRFHPRTK